MEILLKKYFWVVNLAVVAICAILAGRAGAHFIAGAYLAGEEPKPGPGRHGPPPPPPKAHGKESDEIIKRNVFCSGCAPPPPPVETAGGPTSNEPQKSSLQLELVSTMVVPSDDAWSMAVLRDMSTKEKDPAMFNRGMQIFSTGATVVKVVNKRVYIRNGGRLEYLEMEGAAAPPAVASNVPPPPAAPTGDGLDVNPNQIKCNGNNCTIERALVDKALSNTAALATAARFVPSIKDGKPNGFKLYAIRPNSIFGLIGLQNGDTIKGINGMDMSSPDKALEVYTKLRNASHLSVQVERRGESQTLDYTIR
jgi:general secretion pathway protein C